MDDLVRIDRTDGYAVCTLNHPAKRNPLSATMRAALMGAWTSLLSDRAVRSVIVTGEGTAFCSGLDLDGLKAQSQFSPAEHKADAESIRDFFRFVAEFPLPTIAAVNGPAVAGGCGLALLCDITVASEKASFCFSEVKIGFVPALVGVYLERMIGAKRSRDLLLTGRKLTPHDALNWGMVNEIAAEDTLLRRAAAWAELFRENGPEAMRRTKQLLASQATQPILTALESAVLMNADARQSSECVEGVTAFLAKRAPEWRQR